MYIFDLAIENHHRFFVSFIVPENGNNSQDYSTKYHHVNTLDVCHARHNNTKELNRPNEIPSFDT